jgi:predicted metalloprotease with PDZ domain
MVVGEGYGGLEHRASTSLICSRDSLPAPGEQGINDAYLEFLGLCSHEYFHTWNVKRIKPAAFIPEQLDSERYTELLWAFEGITSYYDDLALVRCGLIGPERYLELLGRIATRVWRGSGRSKQSVAESSFDAWSKFYKQDENAPNAIVSYYAKGALVALALDLTLRRETQGRCTLDELMQQLWQRHGQAGVGVPERSIETLAAEISGIDLTNFFADYVYGTDDPPLAGLLAAVGVELGWRAARSEDDRGGTGKPDTAVPLVLGVRTQAADGCLRLTHVFDGSTAQRAGLSAGDLLLALDGLRVTGKSLPAMLTRYHAGDEVVLHVFRRDELMVFTAELQAAPLDTCVLSLMGDAQAACAGWLGDNERFEPHK